MGKVIEGVGELCDCRARLLGHTKALVRMCKKTKQKFGLKEALTTKIIMENTMRMVMSEYGYNFGKYG